MQCRSYTLGLVLLGSCFLLARAAEKDFWNTRSFTEWTEKEVDKLLKNSPWSRSITINMGAMSGSGMGSGGARGGGGFPRGGAVGVEDGDLGGGGGGRGGGGTGAPGMRPIQVVVTWYSKPVRQAMARSITLRNPEAPREELDKLLNYPETPFFDILVIGWTGARGDEEKEIRKLREETCLEKKNKEKISLADMILPKGRGQPLVLLFPKEIDGKPTVTLEDKEVTLRTRVAQNTVRAKFKLAEMLINGEPAL